MQKQEYSKHISSVKRDTAVQTMVEITINDKYTLLDDDTRIVLESENLKSYIQTNFESDADSTASDDEDN